MGKIFVIDDNEIFVKVIKKTLVNKFTCQFVFCHNGEVALDKMDDENPVLILLDIDMPVMNGIDFLKKIRADEKTKDIPVMVLTSSKSKEHVEDALKLGIDDYILKPSTNSEILYEKIRKILYQRNMTC